MYQSFYSNPSPGFPSPADDYADNKLDLNEHLVSNPPATFFVRMQSNAMQNEGIYLGDLLIVDRSLKPDLSSVVVAYLNGDFVVKKFSFFNILTDGDELRIWGVVRYVIHRLHE